MALLLAAVLFLALTMPEARAAEEETVSVAMEPAAQESVPEEAAVPEGGADPDAEDPPAEELSEEPAGEAPDVPEADEETIPVSAGEPDAADAPGPGPEEDPVPAEIGPGIPEEPSLDGASNEETIYSFLVHEMGFNTAAACGVLASMYAESGFNPTVSGDSSSSYGITQWHDWGTGVGRYTNLKNFCAANGYDYHTLTGQLYFLKYELDNSYTTIRNKMKTFPNTAQGAYDAGYYWCYYFCVPANKETVSRARGASARDIYWPKYADAVIAPVPLPSASPVPAPSPLPEPAVYTVTFEGCGGTTPPVVKVTDGGTLSSIPTTERGGFQFMGWFSRENGSGAQLTAATVITQDVIWYAYWIPLPIPIVSYTVSYDAAGGAGAPLPQTKTTATDLVLTKTRPTRSGYAFLGWAEKADASAAEYLPGGVYTDDRDIVLYAVWQRVLPAGDADGDGLVTAADAARIIGGGALSSGDRDGDGAVTRLDAARILQSIVGL